MPIPQPKKEAEEGIKVVGKWERVKDDYFEKNKAKEEIKVEKKEEAQREPEEEIRLS